MNFAAIATEAAARQADIDERNAEYWSFLCGSQQARDLGVTDSSLASLKKFDDWYFASYPYLTRHIPFDAMRGQQVLEIGLGYGTVSQRIAEAGAIYHGLDISPGPVAMANDRMRQIGLREGAVRGSALDSPFADGAMDMVITIGCLHHTGDLQRALDEVWRVLKPGGRAVVMVYNALSYRRWHQHTVETNTYFRWWYLGEGSPPAWNLSALAGYDTNINGETAPATAFVSIDHLRHMCGAFSAFSATLENISQEPPYASQTREDLLQTAIPETSGLDLYATLMK